MELTKLETSAKRFSSIAVSLAESRNSGDPVFLESLEPKIFVGDFFACHVLVHTFNKGDLLRLEDLSSVDKIVKDDFYFRST